MHIYTSICVEQNDLHNTICFTRYLFCQLCKGTQSTKSDESRGAVITVKAKITYENGLGSQGFLPPKKGSAEIACKGNCRIEEGRQSGDLDELYIITASCTAH